MCQELVVAIVERASAEVLNARSRKHKTPLMVAASAGNKPFIHAIMTKQEAGLGSSL